MSGARRYSPAVVRDVKRRRAKGETTRSIAKRHGMSPSTVSNMVNGVVHRPLHEVKREQRERASAIREAARISEVPPTQPVGLVAAAIAERDAGKALVVESLEEKLKRAVSGAVVHDSGEQGVDNRWEVLGPRAYSSGMKVLAVGATKREAIDRAIFLWGER